MKRIICTFKLIRMIWSNNLARELVLFVELTFMVIIIIACLIPINNTLVLSDGIIRTLPINGDLVYCSEFTGINNSIDVDEIKRNFTALYGEEPKIYMSESNSISISNEADTQPETEYGYLILISEELFNDMKIKLSDGVFKKTDPDSDTLSVIISTGFDAKYSVGNTFTCTNEGMLNLIDGQNLKRDLFKIKCEITGILDKSSTLIDIQKYGADIKNANLNFIGLNMSTYENLKFVIAVESNILPIVRKSAAAFAFDNKHSSLSTDLINFNNENTGNYGFSEYNTLKTNSFHQTLKGLNWRIPVMFLLALVLFFNYIGYLIINVKQKNRTVAIMNLCGISFGKSLFINVASTLLAVIPSLIIGLWVAPGVVSIFTNDEFYGYNSLIYIVVIAIFVLSTFLGIAAAHIRRKNSTIINLYKQV